MDSKCCFKCKETKSTTEFYKDKSRSDGYMYQCKACKKGYTLENHDEYKTYLKKRYQENKAEHQKAVKADYVTNKDKYNALARIRYEANKEDQQAKSRAWYEANKDVAQAWMREYYQTHKEQFQAYWKVHSDLQHKHNASRRARLVDAFVDHVDRRTVWERDMMRCCMCTLSVSLDEMHLDHVIPLARGGWHSYNNTQTLCAPCNLRKGAQLSVLQLLS